MASEIKHTPWTACFTYMAGKVIDFHVTDPKHGSTLPVVRSGTFGEGRTPEELTAMGNLIAAAPDLLMAAHESDSLLLRAITVLMNHEIENYLPFNFKNEMRDYLRGSANSRAIAKAEGRS